MSDNGSEVCMAVRADRKGRRYGRAEGVGGGASPPSRVWGCSAIGLPIIL